jgi:hypothetical protein
MHWKIKNLAFKAIAAAPGGKYLHAAGQAIVTRRRRMSIVKSVRTYTIHVDAMKQHGGAEGKTVLEFGAGRNLIASLLVSAAGAERVYAFDIERLATVDLVNDAIAQARELGLSWHGGDPWPSISDLGSDLEAKYRIVYRAPGDAARTGLADGSVDWVCSTATLEHIPAPVIYEIMRESRRVLRADGHSSMIIDYHDHYSSTDKNITPYNFYQYSHKEWEKYNPSMHYVNRLRHSEFLSMFDSLGFDIVECRTLTPENSAEMLANQKIASDFESYTHEDLAVITGIFLLAPRPV